MFKAGTLLVLGAGASAEVNLPVGADLAQSISTSLYFEFDRSDRPQSGADFDFLDALRRHFQDREELNRHLRACRKISEAVQLAESIDNYIDRQEDEAIAFCGKLAIAHLVLKAERESRLSASPPSESFSMTGLPDCWYSTFLRILADGVPVSRLDELFRNITIIDFNYDRCLLHFLRHAIRLAYGVPLSDVDGLLSGLRVIKPYGQVGELRTSGNNGITFGENLASSMLVEVSRGLRTYTEQIEDEALRVRLTTAVSSAEQIIFLGFAFHRQNMALLDADSDARLVLGTAFGFSSPDTEALRNEVVRTFFDTRGTANARIVLERGTYCRDLLRDYRRSVAA